MAHMLSLLLLLAAPGIGDPTDLPGTVLWLDADDVDGDFSSGGAFVGGTTWVDKSAAGGAHATQSQDARLPVVVAGVQNGRSVVRFDGSNDFMDIAAGAAGMLNGVDGATVFAVVMSAGSTPQTQRALMISTDISGRTRAGLNLYDGFGTSLGGSGDFGVAGRRLDSDPYQRIEGGTAAFGLFYHFHSTLDYSSGTLSLYSRGTKLFSAANFQTPGSASPTDSANIRIGADADFCNCRGWFRGDIAELIVYDRVLTGGERGQVEGYFDVKWFNGGLGAYCTAGTSASGCNALVSATGMSSVSAGLGFQVSVSSLEGNKDGILFFGTSGRQANPWGNGTSYQCVVPPVRRTGLQPGGGTSGLCDGAFALDFNTWMAANPTKAPAAGACVDLQYWFRDPWSSSNQTTSFSNAFEFIAGP
jgi:hypothetical protein